MPEIHEFNHEDIKFKNLREAYNSEMEILFKDKPSMRCAKAVQDFQQGTHRVELAHIESQTEIYFAC